jgi:uncharacterized protein YndB with AHSA1/START domain
MPPAEPFRTEVVIDAATDAVWNALVDRDSLRLWMNRAEVTSGWEPGAAISIDVVLEGVVRHDRGTVLEAEPGRRLRYSHWSEISRRPDTPATRSIVTFDLEALPTPEVGANRVGTLLRVTQEGLTAGTAAHHGAFFWRVALVALRAVAEGRPVAGIALADEPRGAS